MFTDILKELMYEENLTQKQLSDKTSIPITTINGWFTTNKKPSYDNIINISKYFNVTADYLLELEDYYDKTSHITAQTEELLLLYSQLDQAKQEKTIAYIKSIFIE